MAAAGSSGSGAKRARSAVTGRFVTQAAVKRSSKTTVNESTTKKRGKSR